MPDTSIPFTGIGWLQDAAKRGRVPIKRPFGNRVVNEHFDLMLKDTRHEWEPDLYPAEGQIRDQAEIDAELRRERGQ